ncbi:ATPase family AAA domain-containing protein 5b isoform X2 [Notolabrus celidotus]|uniref:ATPase family AAA domain-containing protein 5b isoform X2 n=1 Tax=Notolabrus celidotus TaxID=1203425 RepID=UPI00148FB558|nr:ATPase family AAA domain-containing protein 5b isoform X2 [Notolabrus celidotus]
MMCKPKCNQTAFQPMNLTMRNKLKELKKFPHRGQPRIDEVIMLSHPSGSNDEILPEEESASLAVKDEYESKDTVAGKSTRQDKPLVKQRETFSVKDIKIAPIFLHTTQHNRSKRSRNGKPDRSGERLQKSVLTPRGEDLQQEEIQQQHLSTTSHLTKRRLSCREKLSASVLHSCLEDIQTSNPAFPARAVFNTLQKKASEGLQAAGSNDNSLNLILLQSQLKVKRKRGTDTSERVPKRLRTSHAAEGAAGMGHCHTPVPRMMESAVFMVKKPPKSSKLSRTHRQRQQSGSPAARVNNCELNSGLTNHTGAAGQSHKIPDNPPTDFICEDVLWTDKYSPQHSSEVIGNSGSVNKLQSWLQKWKLRADHEERRKMEEKRREENSNDSWDCGDFLGEAGTEDESLCNTMLITGPPGVGKTASVYACSQELGFKVFEVNCSSQRSGHRVLSQLKEATQSHLVETTGKDPLKPTYFNNYSCTPKPDTLPGKTVTPKNGTTAFKKKAAQSLGRSGRKGKCHPAVVTLPNYFKMKNKADLLHSGGLAPSEKPHCKNSDHPSTGSDQRGPQNKKTATSLILFEEVDVIFDDDAGFLAAIKTFMTTTKRPVILTTNDPLFRDRFNCSMEEIIFKAPSEVDVCSYLQLVALAENVQLQLDDVCSLLRLCRGDVRRCLLQLQLWGHSGGGRVSQGEGLPKEPVHKHYSSVERGNNVDSQLPHRETGCTASMLGLPVTREKLQSLLQCQFWSEIDMNNILRLQAESWRRAVPLLYSNLMLLLPTGDKGTSIQLLEKGTELAPSSIHPHTQQLDKGDRPKESATESKSNRSTSRLSRKKYITPIFDTVSSASLITTPPRSSSSPKGARASAHSSRDKTENLKSEVITNFLDALADFFDIMSYVDATLPAATPVALDSSKPEEFVWTGAEIKDGLLDEMREEEEGSRSWSQERLLDIRAAVEGLGCCRCCWRVSEGWNKAQKYRQELEDTEWGKLVEKLTPPASLKRQNLTFSLQPLCEPCVYQKRYKLSKKILCTKPFSLLGNRRAVSVDYMPVLRCICRYQRAQQHTEEPVRCRKYLNRNRLSLSKSTTELLAEDFS